jgi:CRP-like cAMP-binding protein
MAGESSDQPGPSVDKASDHNQHTRRVFLAYASTRLAHVSQRVVCNARHRLGDRLCTWLLMVRDRAAIEILPLTHEEMACHLGARRAGITDVCNSLRDSGIISYHRGSLRIRNRDLLEKTACECYRTLKLGM